MPLTPQQQAINDLRDRYPAWQIWVVPVYLGPDTWCARLHTNHKHLIHAHSPDELDKSLAEASQQTQP